MSATRRHREEVNRLYMEFFELAEKKRRWSLWDDIPWEKLDPSLNDEERALNVETFCAVEFYLPDYVAQGVNLVRESFGQTWFQVNWGYEEAKHGLALRTYLAKSGQRTDQQLFDFEDMIAARAWTMPFQTVRRMTCYGGVQEGATFLAYKRALKNSKEHGDEVLSAIYKLIARDEAAHQEFYRQVLVLELEEDREGCLDDLAYVCENFTMPALDLLPDTEDRMRALRNHQAFDRWGFMTKVWGPFIKRLSISRSEMTRAFKRVRAEQAA